MNSDKILKIMICAAVLIFLPNVFFVKSEVIEPSVGFSFVTTITAIMLNMKALYPESISFWMGRTRVKTTDKKYWFKRACIVTAICLPVSALCTVVTLLTNL